MMQSTRCNYCGANLGPADLDQPACPYCKTVHPHVAQARVQVEGLRQVFAQGGMPGMMGMMPPPGAPGATGAPSPWQHHTGQPLLIAQHHQPATTRRSRSPLPMIVLGLFALGVGVALQMLLRFV